MMKWIILAALFAFCRAQGPLQPIDLEDCGKTKGCMRDPPSCGTNTCKYLVTWQKVSSNDKDYVQVELSGFVKSATGYVAAGFGKSSSMGNDLTVACFNDPVRMAVNPVLGWNTGGSNKGNEKSTDVAQKTLLKTRDDSQPNFLGGYFNAQNNRVECRVRILGKIPNSLDSQKDKLVNLLDGSYYVLVAKGPVKDGKLGYHENTKYVSDRPQDLNKKGVSSAATYPWAKVHGCFMILAWVLCASIGIILARYYKPMWPGKTLSGERPWFQVHRGLQICCMLLTIIGFIIIFVVVGSYSDLRGLPRVAHPILGIIITILVILNPLLALCRCKPTHPDRPWFNWFHWFFGTVAYVLAMPAIFIGLRLEKAGANLPLVDYPVWIMIFFVLFQFAIEIILEVQGCMAYKKDKDKQKEYQALMYEYQNKTGPQVRPREPRPTGHNFKMFMLGLHVCVTCAVALIMIIIICVN